MARKSISKTKPKTGGLEVTDTFKSSAKRRLNKKGFIFIIIIGLILLGFYKKSWFVAATVNNQPLTTLEVIQRMSAIYKEKTVTQLVNEKILEQEAAKNKILVTQAEVDQKITETENQYGGKESFESLLAQQGLTRSELARQTRFQLIVEKLYEKDATISAEELQKFMDENSSAPEATEPAKFKKLAEDQLKQQKISSIFNEKFQQLKTTAKIQIF
ncbi:hypothetical protein A3F00_03535 [Candidatus Daviesbacteria bacterium RIFCSPHIGHO2_12_FULL_37_11]|uniref:peptidylprolyl isomerase n=1 Tax=Candidatus Daviesbacteria bacterium RIFCSPHIGHO2_12_FULL_37_11 TaxID=1797777 RepID=A0A1F5KCY3_9BACT|nr:MAG: hypothetical protein A2111_02715 [Candidatus Daviesbacteria bacterium GWA1_38_6]OGE18014.1 MAG: hypothetical protein A2769_01105 [Candidatus Daviesbacteria bacterium RIFCSPHIGHO2_01_FULL_37_27]OGE38714.1 MAG: hypothetical protein A3F00_03535 [Candidatus Daviesbacteria bacterium RIFCSPHIGHO2_12_FULL_37_11]OGE45804.1 MAG: hypothetical protein A3B39_01075 [Candidatus Daviesbacteria bacterium RIFCSPLOWO2_01_FULL_37_10]